MNEIISNNTGIQTGIYIGTSIDGQPGPTFDIGDPQLPNEAVVGWLRHRGGWNIFAENLVLMFLGREQNADKIPVYIDAGRYIYKGVGRDLSIVPGTEGLTININTVLKQHLHVVVKKEDAHVFNAVLLLALAMRVKESN